MRPNTSPVALLDLLAVEQAQQVFEHVGLEDAVVLGQLTLESGSNSRSMAFMASTTSCARSAPLGSLQHARRSGLPSAA